MYDPKFGPSFQGGETTRPNEPVQQMQQARGFIDGCANQVTLISWEAEHTEQQIGQAFYAKNHTISILHTGYKVIGYTFAKQSYWYKLCGLHVYKAILLAQTSWAFVQT